MYRDIRFAAIYTSLFAQSTHAGLRKM